MAQRKPCFNLIFINFGVLLLFVATVSDAARAQTPRPARPAQPSAREAGENFGSIRGRVVLANGAFVNRAIKITLEVSRGAQTTAYTDNQGQFEIGALAPGTYTLEFEGDRQRFEVATERVQVMRGLPSILTVQLKEKTAENASQPATRVVSTGELDNRAPSKAVAHFNRASAYAREKRIEEAIGELLKAIAIYPHYLVAHNDLGALLLGQGKLDAAAEALRAAIEIDQNSFNPRLNLGIVLVQQHDFEAAKEMLKVAERLDPQSPAVRLYAGMALVGTGDLEAAEKELKTAYTLGGSPFALALFHLGQLYMTRDEREMALSSFAAYLRETPNAANAAQVRQLISMLR